MKVPFYTIIGPSLRKQRYLINFACNQGALVFAPFYVGVLGVLGVLLSIFDMWRIVKCGPILPGYLYRQRGKVKKVISLEAERDCKLISLVFSVEYYFFLLVGLITNNPIFYMPFLLLYAIIITLECILFFVRLLVDGFGFPKKSIVMTVFMVYNWCSVACLFARSMSCCDL